MILVSQNKVLRLYILYALAIIALFFLLTNSAWAAEGDIELSISPPIMRIALSPGESWSSELQIINNSIEAIEITAESAHLDIAKGETKAKFSPIFLSEKEKKATLSGWITLREKTAIIVRKSSVNIPFNINLYRLSLFFQP